MYKLLIVCLSQSLRRSGQWCGLRGEEQYLVHPYHKSRLPSWASAQCLAKGYIQKEQEQEDICVPRTF